MSVTLVDIDIMPVLCYAVLSCHYPVILPAMEQQSVSVAKSGVVTSLRCRTTVLAAANPVGGTYDRRKSVSENLKMASALLSRFDLVFIMLDRPDMERDRLISEHVMRMSTTSAVTSRQLRPLHLQDGDTGMKEEDDSAAPLTLTQRLRRAVSHVDTAVYTTSAAPTPAPAQVSSLLSCAALKPLLGSSPELLREYIAYARQYCHPSLSIPAAKVREARS